MLKQFQNDSAARAACRVSPSIRFFEGEMKPVDQIHAQALRVWISLTRAGQLVLTTRLVNYDRRTRLQIPGGPAAKSQFTTERQACDFLRENNIADLPGITIDIPNKGGSLHTPDVVRMLLRRTFGTWSAHELKQVVDWVYTWHM